MEQHFKVCAFYPLSITETWKESFSRAVYSVSINLCFFSVICFVWCDLKMTRGWSLISLFFFPEMKEWIGGCYPPFYVNRHSQRLLNYFTYCNLLSFCECEKFSFMLFYFLRSPFIITKKKKDREGVETTSTFNGNKFHIFLIVRISTTPQKNKQSKMVSTIAWSGIIIITEICGFRLSF